MSPPGHAAGPGCPRRAFGGEQGGDTILRMWVGSSSPSDPHGMLDQMMPVWPGGADHVRMLWAILLGQRPCGAGSSWVDACTPPLCLSMSAFCFGISLVAAGAAVLSSPLQHFSFHVTRPGKGWELGRPGCHQVSLAALLCSSVWPQESHCGATITLSPILPCSTEL